MAPPIWALPKKKLTAGSGRPRASWASPSSSFPCLPLTCPAEPEVLILDEPTAGLDPIGRAEILGNIQAYRQAKNAAVLMVSHSMEDVAKLTDRLLVMNGSKLAMDGTPEQVFTHVEELLAMGLSIPQVTQVFLRLRHMGVNVPNVYTLEQATEVLLRLKEEQAHA